VGLHWLTCNNSQAAWHTNTQQVAKHHRKQQQQQQQQQQLADD